MLLIWNVTNIWNVFRNKDGYLSLSEYMGMDEDDLETMSLAADLQSFKKNVEYFYLQLDTNRDGILSPPEILSWVSDNKRHLRDKTEKIIKKLDKNHDKLLDIDTEILGNVNYFTEHELTRYGDLLFYQDEL